MICVRRAADGASAFGKTMCGSFYYGFMTSTGCPTGVRTVAVVRPSRPAVVRGMLILTTVLYDDTVKIAHAR